MKLAILVVSAVSLLAAPGHTQQIKAAYQNPHPPAQGSGTVATESTVLWDQSATPMTFGFVDQVFTDYGGYDTFLVNDISVPANEAWNVTSITTSYTTNSGAWSAATITSARVQVYPKTGALPSDATDIAPEYTVPATLTLSGVSWLLKADTSGIAELQAIQGDFWVGATPVTAFLVHGQEFHWKATSLVGDETAKRNPGGAFALGTTWGSISAFDIPVVTGPPYETTILLEGDIRVPTWAPFLGTGKPGLFGPVVDTETGIPSAGLPVSMTVTGLTQDFPVPSLGALFIGFGTLMVPFKGGTFVPTPDFLLLIPMDTVGDGGVAGAWPTGVPAGTVLNLQWWTKGLFGYAASDGFSVTAQ